VRDAQAGFGCAHQQREQQNEQDPFIHFVQPSLHSRRFLVG
jgi:hypothetical protein